MDLRSIASGLTAAIFGGGKASAPAGLAEQFTTALVGEILPQRPLIDSDTGKIEDLRRLSEHLSLLELILDRDAGNSLAKALRQTLQPDNEERLEQLRDLRDFEDPEVRHFLALAARLNVEPEFRAEAVTTLLCDPRDGELEFIRTLFRDTKDVTFRQAAIYAFEPAETVELRAALISGFPKFSPELRLSALQLLMPFKGQADVGDFIANDEQFSDADRKFIREN